MRHARNQMDEGIMCQVTPMNNALARQDLVLKLASEAAVGMRSLARKAGIGKASDFVDVVTLTAVLVQQRFRDQRGDKAAQGFADVLSQRGHDFREILETGQHREALAEMESDTSQDGTLAKGDKLITCGLESESRMIKLARDAELTADETMVVMAMIMTMAVVANADPNVSDIILDEVLKVARENAAEWERQLPIIDDDEL